MSKRSFNILAICTFLAVVAAFWAIQQEWSRWGASDYGSKLFPELAESLDDVARVRILHGGTHITVERTSQGWTVAESDGYPAHTKTIQELLYAMSQARRVEPKTQDPKKFAKLHVEDPTQKDSEAKQIDVYDKAGHNIASLILGKENLVLQVIGEGGAYIRLPGQKQSWLASGNLVASAEFKDWLDNPILDISRKRIARAIIMHPNGDRLVVSRSEKEDEPFVVEGMKPDEKLVSEYYPTDIGRALEKFEAHQVRHRAEVPFPADSTIKGEHHTIDGLTVAFELTTVAGKDWIRFTSAEGQSPESSAEGKKLMDRLGPWAFQIPEFESIHIKKTRSQVVEKAKPQS